MLKGKGNYTGRVIRYFQITANGQKSTLSGKCGKNAYWILIDDTLCIYGNGITYDYRDVSPWYEYRTRIKKLLFPLASQESEALPFGIARILPLFSSLLQSQSLAPVPLLIVFA